MSEATDFGKLIDDAGEMLPRLSQLLGDVSGLLCASFQRGLGDAAHCRRVDIAFAEAGAPRLYFQLLLPDGRHFTLCEPLLGLHQSVMPEVVERGAITATSITYGLLPVPKPGLTPSEEANGARMSQVSVETLVRQLDEARALAIKSKDPAAAIAAIMGMAKLRDLIVDRISLSGSLDVRSRRVSMRVRRGGMADGARGNG